MPGRSIGMVSTAGTNEVELARFVWTDPDRMSGTPCFAGTRVPVQNLFDYLEGGSNIEDFLDDFEGVSREQAIAVIELAAQRFIVELEHA